MRVVIAGGHGKIALQLSRLLARRADAVVGLIRNPDHADEVAATGAEAVVFDLEIGRLTELAEQLEGADAVVFAAGAGPGSGIPRKDTVDRAGAALLAGAAERAGVRRYLLVSSMGVAVDDPGWTGTGTGTGTGPTGTRPTSARLAGTSDVFAAYLQAKAASERDLRTRDLDWTVLRPGSLTDRDPTGTVRLGVPTVERGEISRADVAAVLVALLDEPRSVGLTLEVVVGDIPIADAVRSAVTR